jgi:hypothetical protein
MAYPATGDGDNVTTGPGWLYVAPLATTDPTTGASAALPSAWEEIGYTDAGSTFTTDITSEAIEVAEEVDELRKVQSKRVTTVAFAMAETTRRNMLLALGAGLEANGTDPFEPPELDDLLSVKVVFEAVTGARWLFRSCAPSGQISIQNAKAPQKRLIAVTLNLEVPTGGLAPFKVWPNADGLI